MASKFFTLLPIKTLSRGSNHLSSIHTGIRTIATFSPSTRPTIICRSFLPPTTVLKPTTRSINIPLPGPKMDPTTGHENGGQKPVEDWQKRPPYKIHEDNSKFKARYEAACHCGKVKYQLSREEPLDSKLCHCTTCQTQHAAPFQWAAIFHKDDINFSHGHHDLEWYDPTDRSIEHKLPCKVRCSFCHSPIMDEGRNMILLFPSLIHLKTDEDRANFKPRCHMFYGQRVMDVPDGLPKWSGLNESSDLIEDSPPDLVREHERKREKERKERKEKEEKEQEKDGKKEDKKGDKKE